MAISSNNFTDLNNIISFYEDSLSWTPNLKCKLKKYINTINQREAVVHNFIFEIGNLFLYIQSYDCKVDIENLFKIEKYQDLTSIITMEKLLGKEIIKEISQVILSNELL